MTRISDNIDAMGMDVDLIEQHTGTTADHLSDIDTRLEVMEGYLSSIQDDAAQIRFLFEDGAGPAEVVGLLREIRDALTRDRGPADV